MSSAERAYYLYCLAPGGTIEPSEAGVFVQACSGIAAVLSEVPRREFCGAAAEERLRDLAWLAPRACRHEAVVEQVMRQSAVLPARFATLFSSLESLQRFVGRHRAAIEEFFARLGGQREWAVKGLLDRRLACRREKAACGDVSPGKNYLRSKRLEAEARERLDARLQSSCEEAARQLEESASAFRAHKVWVRSGADPRVEVILNWAFLLHPGAEPDFRRRVEELDGRHSATGLSFTCSGPWPPYSFAPELESATEYRELPPECDFHTTASNQAGEALK